MVFFSFASEKESQHDKKQITSEGIKIALPDHLSEMA